MGAPLKATALSLSNKKVKVEKSKNDNLLSFFSKEELKIRSKEEIKSRRSDAYAFVY